jgi:hypothetical protein
MAISIDIRHESIDCHYAEYLYAECLYAECLYAECLYAECLYAECRYAGCRSAFQTSSNHFYKKIIL